MFFTAFITTIHEARKTRCICYTDRSIADGFPEGVTEKDARQLMDEFGRNWSNRSPAADIGIIPPDTDYIIAFLWEDESGPSVDLWLARQLDTYTSSPLITLKSYRHDGEENDPWGKGNGTGDAVIVVGREEELRRRHMANGGSLEGYLSGPRPQLPKSLIAPWPSRPRVKGGYGDVT